MAGLLLPLFSLHTTTPNRIGDFGAPSREFVDLLVEANLDRWLFLPAGPGRVDRRLCLLRSCLYGNADVTQQELRTAFEPLQLNKEPLWFDKCPYIPASAFAVNPIYLDVRELQLSTTKLTPSLYVEPEHKQGDRCAWISAWIEKNEYLAVAFHTKQQWLCTDRGFLKQLRHLILHESCRKLQRQHEHSARTIKRNLAKAAKEDEESTDACVTSTAAVVATSCLEEEESITGDCTATAAQSTDLLTEDSFADEEFGRECPLPLEGWPEWLQALWTFISQEDCRRWILDYAAYEASLDREAVSEMARLTSDKERSKGCFVRDWQKWKCSKIPSERRLLTLWDNSDPQFIELTGDLVVSHNFQKSFIFHLYSQFLVTTQLRNLNQYALDRGVELCGDSPIYLPLQSCDCWASPSLFGLNPDTGKPSAVSGLPPDYWSAHGQLWGTPIYDWERVPDALEDWWCLRLRYALSLTRNIRIDHFRAFADYWAVPIEWAESEHNGIGGAWLEGPGAPLFDRFFMENATIEPSRIIVEDLCEATPSFLKMQAAVPFARMEVLQFQLEHLANAKPDGPEYTSSWLMGHAPHPIVVFSGTHDNPTLKEWFEKSASEQVKTFISEQLGKVVLRSNMLPRFLLSWMMKKIRVACRDQAVMVFVPVQDVLCLGAEARLNRPGEFDPTLWSWKLNSENMSELSAPTTVKWMRSELQRLL